MMLSAAPSRQHMLARGLRSPQFLALPVKGLCVGSRHAAGCSSGPRLGAIRTRFPATLHTRAHSNKQAPMLASSHDDILLGYNQQPQDGFTKLSIMMQRVAMAVCLAPLLLFGFHSNDAAYAARKQAAPTSTNAAYPSSTASTEAHPTHPSLFKLDISKMTTMQAVQSVFMSPEGQVLIRIVAGVFMLYVVTRRPDPPTGSVTSTTGPVTKSWLITSNSAVEVDTNSLPKPPAPKAAAASDPATNSTSRSRAAQLKERSPSVAASAIAAAAAAASNGAPSNNGTPQPSGTNSSGSRTNSPTRRSASAEPGVLAVGLTAAALDSFAPLGQFVMSGVVPAMMAAAKSTVAAIEAGNSSNDVPSTISSNPDGVALVAWAAGTAQSVTGSAHSHKAVPGGPSAAPAQATKRSPSPVPATPPVVMAASIQSSSSMSPSPSPTAGPSSVVLATPLTLNPVYPPSKAYFPRPVSLGATFRSSHRDVRTEAWGVLGALADLANKPLGAKADGQASAATELAPPSIIPSKSPIVVSTVDPALLEAAPVSSVVAYNLALASRKMPLPELSAAISSSPSSPAAGTAALAVDGEPVSRVVTRNLAESARLAIAERLARADAQRQAAAQAQEAQAAIAAQDARVAGAFASAAAADAASKGAAVDSLKAVQGVVDAMESVMQAASEASGMLSDSQLASVDAVVKEARIALHGKSSGEDGSGVMNQEAAVERWTSMIRESPERAAAAVAEARAVADALVEDIEQSMSTRPDLGQRAVSKEDAQATANALGGKKPNQPQQWYWAWAWGMSDQVSSFLDPIRAVLRFTPPTVRSKYDPMTFLRNWSPPSGQNNLPSWDPIHRLHSMLRDPAAAPKARSPPSKYDAIAQLVEFLASLPEVVASAEWAEAAAADPLRRLLADAAGRSNSVILSTATAIKQSKAQRERAVSNRRFWAKYDPLADLFAPELPLNAHWDEVVQEMLALEAVCGPVVPRFSALQVMHERGGQGFQSALVEFKQVAVSDEGAESLKTNHPAISTWLQASSNVALANCAGDVKLGPVWGVLLLPRYQATLLAARAALPGFMRDLDRRHPSLHSLLKRKDSEQSLVLLSTLAAWVVGEEMAATGRPPRTLSPSPQPVEVTAGTAARTKTNAAS